MRAGRETILGYVERANPVDILAELIWNALDAEAMNVETTVTLGPTGAPEEIVIRDDGHGMPHDQVPDLFLTHGESWKRNTGFSPTLNRPMHGQLGRGRFLVYGIADRVEWRSVSADGDGFGETLVQGSLSSPNEFTFDGPWPSTGPTGTTVRMAARQLSRVTRIGDGDIQLPLTARLAATLLGLHGVEVTYRGQSLDPQAHITRDTDVELATDPAILHGRSRPRLRVVEWSADMRSKTLYLCDERGGVVTEYKPARLPLAPIHWTAYLQWEGFRDPTLMGRADLHVPDLQHGELLATARHALVDYLKRRTDDQKGRILAGWKADGVYPYRGEARSAAEQVEREIFDIVAVLASPVIGREVRQKKLALQLLREATRAEPSRTNHILNTVLDLSATEREVLSELLERTTLTATVRTAQTVADRSDVLRRLRGLVHANESRTVFRDVDQIHPLLVAQPWVFGDEWQLAVSESALTPVVQASVTRHADVEFAQSPVTLPSDRRGRVDMAFYRHVPDSERPRHLVVTLKRPMRLTRTEFDRIDDLASAVTGHPEVVSTPDVWDFWLVGTAVDGALPDLDRPVDKPRYRIWVVTWEQLLDDAEHRVRAFREALDLASTDSAGRDYLRRRHAEFIPPD